MTYISESGERRQVRNIVPGLIFALVSIADNRGTRPFHQHLMIPYEI